MTVTELVGIHVGAFAIGWCLGWMWHAYKRVVESAT